MSRVVVAMSGGVDSSVAAALMVNEGHEVIGITMQLYDYGNAPKKKGSCCAGQDIYDAAQVAESLGIRHYILNYEDKFREGVIEDFVDQYVAGYTPIPCVKCNQTVKFRDLIKAAKDLDAEKLVTGHYVQKILGPNGYELHQGSDPRKDQSYFLFATTYDQLSYLEFPLGGYTKEYTRSIAESLNLEVSDKPDSQDICFVPDGNYSAVISRYRPGAIDPGNIVDTDGKILAKHNGIIHFTIGQRRGLGFTIGEPIYVVEIRADKKEVVVGPHSMLEKRIIKLKDINFVSQDRIKECRVKIRSSHSPIEAIMIDDDTVELIEPYFGISPGQACVIYDGTKLIGGGWILSAS
jgi:tRNA-uridine 2-sulfurtransferase